MQIITNNVRDQWILAQNSKFLGDTGVAEPASVLDQFVTAGQGHLVQTWLPSVQMQRRGVSSQVATSGSGSQSKSGVDTGIFFFFF